MSSSSDRLWTFPIANRVCTVSHTFCESTRAGISLSHISQIRELLVTGLAGCFAADCFRNSGNQALRFRETLTLLSMAPGSSRLVVG